MTVVGFYIRKSVSVGPFRFNLSNSGIGLSTGVKGFRIGTGPRGNYVHMGRGGLYFRSTLPGSPIRRPPPAIQRADSPGIQFHEIESGNVDEMVDSSSADLLQEINAKSRKVRFWPWASGASVCLLATMAVSNVPLWAYSVVLPLCAGGVFWAAYADKLRKSVVLFYQMESHIEAAYQNLHNAFSTLCSCSRIWHIEARGNVVTTYDWKVHAGADAVIRRKATNPAVGVPPYFHCNISIPVLPAGRRKLYFLPDRILVWDRAGVGAVGFDQVEINSLERRFIESESVPKDAQVVDTTWRFVNKSGGPDRRFNNNRQIPIALYEEVLFASKTGLQELYQCSRTRIAAGLKTALAGMASAISQSDNPPATPEGYIKCPCNNCDIFIEFPVAGLGQTIKCPHCGLDTVLFKPEITG